MEARELVCAPLLCLVCASGRGWPLGEWLTHAVQEQVECGELWRCEIVYERESMRCDGEWCAVRVSLCSCGGVCLCFSSAIRIVSFRVSTRTLKH